MKTAKPPATAVEATSSRRSQPVRQTRTNPPRTTSGPNRTLTRDSLVGRPALDQTIDIFPAVTHFVDAITALPKELVKHFTLLKEVDAKVHLPEQALFHLIDAALNAPPPEQMRSSQDGTSSITPASVPMSVQNSSSGIILNGHLPALPSADDALSTGVFSPSNVPRRQLFRQVAFEIKEMLVALEEKNHVLSTANEALHKQLARIDDVWPHLMDEFSDEAKWGSTTHWAYAENRAGRSNNAQAERSRREGAASLSAAAQAIAEEAAARSDARKQAVALKKSLKNQQQHQESDFDDHDVKQRAETSKKSTSAKSRKAPPTELAPGVGLGISNTATAGGGGQPAKRRKVEKPANGGVPMERAMSSVYGANASKPRTASPRETPAPEGATKKRKALPAGAGQAKKSRTGAAMSPSITSSPVVATFPDTTKVARSSPAPAVSAPRPASSRARQNSTNSTVEIGKARPPSAAATKEPNGVPTVLPELAPQTNGVRVPNEKAKEPPVPAKVEVSKPEIEAPAPTSIVTSGPTSKKEVAVRLDEVEAKTEVVPPAPIAQTITTKSGRASKPSTPALATFAEAAAKSRPTRVSEANAIKRSHKKGASAAAAAQALAAQLVDDDANSSRQDDEEEDPLYCYCNAVSYGEMIACDAKDCAKEWFHLECVGLKVAPKGNVKWYCEDCKKRMKVGERKSNGR